MFDFLWMWQTDTWTSIVMSPSWTLASQAELKFFQAKLATFKIRARYKLDRSYFHEAKVTYSCGQNTTFVLPCMMWNLVSWEKLFGYSKHSYGLDLSCPNRKRLEVSKYVKYIAVNSRASKLQVSKFGELQDLNPGLPSGSISLW